MRSPWYPRRDSNPHGRSLGILSPLCLPFHHAGPPPVLTQNIHLDQSFDRCRRTSDAAAFRRSRPARVRPLVTGGALGFPRPMRALLLLTICLLLAGCGRPLTESEVSYLRALQGEQTNPDRVRLHDGHFAGSFRYQMPARPRLTCQERIWPPVGGETITVSPGATVIFNRVFYRDDLYEDDLMAGWPEEVDLFQAMLFAHEMTHVWQWQNRRRTGYSPLKALGEHTVSEDPYLFDPEESGRFLDHGYEQQGSIVEEYVCCRLLDPEAPRTARLREMISAEMPITRLDDVLDSPRVRIPWAGAKVEGICR